MEQNGGLVLLSLLPEEYRLRLFVIKTRVAEPENLKTVPVSTFYLITVPVPAPVLDHIRTCIYIYIYIYVYLYVFVNVGIRTYMYIYLNIYVLIQYIYTYVQMSILGPIHACTCTYTNTYT